MLKDLIDFNMRWALTIAYLLLGLIFAVISFISGKSTHCELFIIVCQLDFFTMTKTSIAFAIPALILLLLGFMRVFQTLTLNREKALSVKDYASNEPAE